LELRELAQTPRIKAQGKTQGTKNEEGELKRKEDGWEGQVDFTYI